MNHGSLFSGIGGFDLAAEWMGWNNKFHCEWNPFGQKVLKYHFPKAISYEDITKTDFSLWRGRIDILSGGFPCQPYSLAGKRLGKEDERHLWPEMLRAIREIQPRWVVGENVLGLVNWNGGLVFHEVQAELEAQGYEVIPFVLPACAVNAPHRRDRVWFVAFNAKFPADGGHNAGEGAGVGLEMVGNIMDKARWNQSTNDLKSPGIDASNSCSNGFYGSKNGQSHRKGDDANSSGKDATCQFERRGGEAAGEDGTTTDTGRIGEGASFKSERASDNIAGRCCNEDSGSQEPCNKGWLITDTSSQQGERGELEQREHSIQEQGEFGGNGCSVGSGGDDSDSNGLGLRGEGDRSGKSGQFSETLSPINWQDFPTQSPVCDGDDGISSQLDGIAFSKWRAESIKAGGNAIVPQVALQIFKAIQQYENL